MMRTYKEFYDFVKACKPEICELYDDFLNRKDPEPGDRFKTASVNVELFGSLTFVEVIYDSVELDGSFDNGTAFFYKFHLEEYPNIELRIRSINKINDFNKLSNNDRKDLYAFWTKCYPLNT